MRPEPRRVQGSPALNVVQGGLKNKNADWEKYISEKFNSESVGARCRAPRRGLDGAKIEGKDIADEKAEI